MKRKLKEEFVILVSVVKWIIIATFIGIVVGLSTTIFLKALNFSIDIAARHPYYFLLLPLVLLFNVIFIRYLAPDAKGHGTEKVIEAVHKYSGKIKPIVVPVKAIATILTIASGGSVGKEGPCAQIGAGLASSFADIFKLDDGDRKKVVICGISAGFASIFGTPIAGAIFGVEVMFVGDILYDVLLPSFVSGVVAYHLASYLGITYSYYPLNFAAMFSEVFFAKIIISGIFFGICSFLLIEILKAVTTLTERIKETFVKPIIGGMALIILTLIFSKRYLGLGIETIQEALDGKEIIWYAFLVKILFTSITLNFGGSGGVVTPIFFIGSTAGSIIAPILNIDRATLSSVGMVALLAGSANTPIAASIMAVELFGAKIATYASLACIVSFLITGHRSVYPSQIIGIRKSRSIHIKLGEEIEDVDVKIQPRNNSFIANLQEWTRIFKKILKK